MRQKFPDGSGGLYEVPGVGRVIGGEPFDYPELISACVPVEDSADEATQDDDSTAEPSPPGEPQKKVGAAEAPSEPSTKTAAKGSRP